MKKLLTLVLTLAMCLPMFIATSVEVKAEETSDGIYRVEMQGPEHDYRVSYGSSNYEQFESTTLYLICPNSKVISFDIPIANGVWDIMSYIEECGSGEYEVIMEVDGVSVISDSREITYEQKHYRVSVCHDTSKEGLKANWTGLEFDKSDITVQEIIDKFEQKYEYKLKVKEGKIYADINLNCEINGSIKLGGTPLEVYLIFEWVGENSLSGNSVPKVEEPKEKAPTQAEIEQMRTEAIAKATEEVISREEAIPVTDFISTEAISALPAEVKESTGEATVYNLSKITTTQGFVAAVNKIVEANKGANGKVEKAVTFYSSTPIAFNATSLTALSDAATEFVYMFRHEGHLYQITIPAGAKVDLAGQKFAGPLYIGAQLGTSKLVK